jgi:hypothetical protein
MAGRDQSARLQGLLSGIADSVGELGAGGDWTSDAIRNITRPEIDTTDSASLIRYADWARRNGLDDEAKQYMALGYRQKEKEAQEAKDAALGATMAEAGDIGARGQTLGASGDLGGADATVAQLRKQLADPEVRKNPDAVRAIMQEISTLQQNRSEYVAANTDAIVQGVAQMDQQIATLSKDDPQYAVKKANYEAARANFLSRPGVEQAYESQKLELMETNSAKMDAMWRQQSPAILAEMRLAGTDVDELENIQNKYPQFASQIIAVEGTMLDLAERRQEIRAADFRVEDLEPRIEGEIKEIEESNLPDPIKKQSIDLLNRAKGAVEGGKINPNSAIEAYDKARGQVDQLLINEAAAQSGVIRQRQERAEINYEKAQQTRITDTEVMKTAVALYGDNPSKDELAQVEGDLTEELQNYRLRTAIAAGYEDPMRMDSQDKKAVAEGLKDGTFGDPNEVPRDVRVMRATYDLVAQGFDREDVVNFLRKELPEKERKHAEAIFDDMWADVTSQDAVTAKPAQVSSYTDGLRAVRDQEAPLVTWYKRATETLEGRYQGFLGRRSQTMTTRLEEVSGPSVTVRQKANLSLPMGPLGSQGSKLRDAREGQQPTGEYPYPGDGVNVQPLSQDYIYPTYRGLGG